MQQETRSIRNALKMQVGTPERRSSIIGDVFSFFFHLSFFDFLLGRSRTKALEQLIKIYFLIFNTFLRRRENYLKYIFLYSDAQTISRYTTSVIICKIILSNINNFFY